MTQNHNEKITDEELVAEFNKTPHLGKLSHHFSLPTITIWRRLERLNLRCKTKSGGYLKGTGFPINDILDGKHPYYPTSKLSKRLIKENIFINECSRCKISSWEGESIVLHLDHINGISTDHRLDNLRLLCPNCHSQTETYCGRNKRKKSSVKCPMDYQCVSANDGELGEAVTL